MLGSIRRTRDVALMQAMHAGAPRHRDTPSTCKRTGNQTPRLPSAARGHQKALARATAHLTHHRHASGPHSQPPHEQTATGAELSDAQSVCAEPAATRHPPWVSASTARGAAANSASGVCCCHGAGIPAPIRHGQAQAQPQEQHALPCHRLQLWVECWHPASVRATPQIRWMCTTHMLAGN